MIPSLLFSLYSIPYAQYFPSFLSFSTNIIFKSSVSYTIFFSYKLKRCTSSAFRPILASCYSYFYSFFFFKWTIFIYTWHVSFRNFSSTHPKGDLLHLINKCLQEIFPGGFSLRWLLLLWSTGLRARGLGSCGYRALGHRFSSCDAWAWMLCGMWGLPRSEIEPMSPTLAGGFFTTGQPGKPTLFSEGETQVQRRLKKVT